MCTRNGWVRDVSARMIGGIDVALGFGRHRGGEM